MLKVPMELTIHRHELSELYANMRDNLHFYSMSGHGTRIIALKKDCCLQHF